MLLLHLYELVMSAFAQQHIQLLSNTKHDTVVKHIKGDTGTDISLKERDILNSIKTSATNIQLCGVAIPTHKDNKKQVRKTSSQWHEYE